MHSRRKRQRELAERLDIEAQVLADVDYGFEKKYIGDNIGTVYFMLLGLI